MKQDQKNQLLAVLYHEVSLAQALALDASTSGQSTKARDWLAYAEGILWAVRLLEAVRPE